MTRLRPVSRRWRRTILATVLIAIGVVGNLVVYAAQDDRQIVLQLASDVPAGRALTSMDLIDVALAFDAGVPLISVSDAHAVIGQYAVTRLVAGTLLTPAMIQPDTLLTPGQAVVAIRVEESGIPAGLGPRSSVDLIIGSSSPTGAPLIAAEVVEIGNADIAGRLSVSVEVSEQDARSLVLADRVGIILRPVDRGEGR